MQILKNLVYFFILGFSFNSCFGLNSEFCLSGCEESSGSDTPQVQSFNITQWKFSDNSDEQGYSFCTAAAAMVGGALLRGNIFKLNENTLSDLYRDALKNYKTIIAKLPHNTVGNRKFLDIADIRNSVELFNLT